MTEAEVSNKNQDVLRFIHYYLGLQSPPNYAVMLTGPWGVGKTFELKRLISELQLPAGAYLYVSLYGMRDREEIDLALLKALYPLLNTPTGQILSSVGAGALKYLNFDVNTEAARAQVLKSKAPTIYIFDDLERCKMDGAEMLGYINQFVEHDGRKVILIANEEELARSDEKYLRTREKVIGRAFRISGSSHSAINAFLARVPDLAIRAILDDLKATVLEVFDQSGLDNLRLLQNSILDCSRVLKLIEPEKLKHSEGLSLLVRLMLIASFEVHSGRLPRVMLRDRIHEMVKAGERRTDDSDVSPMKAASGRYGQANLTSDVLSDDLLCDFLDFGIVDRRELNRWLETCGHFGDKNVPAWRILWHSHIVPDDELEVAFVELDQQFAMRSIVDPGIILHVFGLRLWMARLSMIDESIESVVETCKKYVDDLLSSGKLPPSADRGDQDFAWTGGYDGLAIHEHKTTEYAQLYQYLQQARQSAQERADERSATEVLLEMQSDPASLRAKLWDRNAPSHSIAHRPVLMHIDVANFATAFLQLHPEEQHFLAVALVARMSGSSRSVLECELPWLSKVADELDKFSQSLPRFSRARVRSRVEYLRSAQEGT